MPYRYGDFRLGGRLSNRSGATVIEGLFSLCQTFGKADRPGFKIGRMRPRRSDWLY